MNTDHAGHIVSGATAAGIEFYEQAAHEFRCMIADPVATIDRAIAECPAMPMAYVLKGWAHLLGTEPEALPIARDCVRQALRFAAGDRERAHAQALRAAGDGRWREAGRLLEDLGARWPLDALALHAGHQVDFLCGDSRMLRDRIARALPAWDASMPGFHALLGMYAFGLEETGEYEQAERHGRRAVELQPRDSWAWHAVAHVHEMRNRPDVGIEWLDPHAAHWAPDSFLAVHNWWHLALFRLERDEVDEALRLFDGPIFDARSSVVFDLVDATAMLWRLHLRGIDVGDRWEAVADRWMPIAGAGNYAFNDVHAMMSFVGAGRREARELVFDAQRAALRHDGDNAAFVREVGDAVTRAVAAFGDGDYAQTVRLLRSIRSCSHRFGGSHAQRDVIDLTLIESAIRAGDRSLARALAAERAARRPDSRGARRFIERADRIEPSRAGSDAAEPLAA
ncbi:MAG: tetratricopeptide repeat protein [Burkholderiaceae bacterium]|nr:tetratricopeptide repeat protein [Burkholderiaceae bacterium]